VRARADRGGKPVALGLLGRPVFVSEPAVLRSEAGAPCAYVHIDLADGADLAGYVDRARTEVDKALSSGKVALRGGERVEWTGQYPLLRAGERRLALIAPLVALSMLGLLLLQFRSIAKALIVFASVPFALVGSIWTLYFLDYRLSAPVWVGLLSVVGLAMQTGVLMIVYIDDAFERRVAAGRMKTREDVIDAHAEGTVLRLRPKIMTIVTMGACLLPLLWADGAGAEIMRRIAAPMVGGLVTSAFLTLEVLPVLYTLWRVRQLETSRDALPAPTVGGELAAASNSASGA
jgi:copper/silver efflux system protein